MKKIICSLKYNLGEVFALCLLTAVLSSTGCKSVPVTDAAGVTVTKSVPDVDLMCSTAKSAAYLGTEIYLYGLPPRLPGHPQDRAAFETALSSLRALIAAGAFTAGDLTAALQALPVKELQGGEGTLLVGEAVILWDQYGRQLASLDKAKVFDTYILPVAQSICAGLDMALGQTPPSPSPATP